MYSCAVLTKHVSDVFELETHFDDGTVIDRKWLNIS